MYRKLSPEFIKNLKEGILRPILQLIQNDHTLDLQIRKEYLNIYYRGGNLLKIKEMSEQSKYDIQFDNKYTKIKQPISFICNIDNLKSVKNQKDCDDLIKIIPNIKQTMDCYFASKSKKNEREFQQLIVRENNYSGTNVTRSTDYYICDIEYAEKSGRYDMVAVQWESNSQARRNNKNLGLSLIEVKYGDTALREGKSGIIDHLNDVNNFLSQKDKLNNLKNNMKEIFNQKIDLGLINCGNTINSLNDEKPEYIFILINHDPEKSALSEELEKINEDNYQNINIRFVVSNFMGYSLYKNNIFSLTDFKKRYKNQIYVNRGCKEGL